MMTVLYIQPVSERGGSDQALLRMVRALQSQVRCHIAAPSPHPLTPAFEAAGATLHVVPMRRITRSGGLTWWIVYALGWPVAVIRLALLIRRTGADVVHTNSLHSWYGWAAARIIGRPHIWHARETVVQSSLALRLEQVLTRRFAAVVPCTSVAVAAQLPGAATRIVTDDADRDEFNPARAGAFRARVGMADDVPLLAMAGRVDTWKGVEVVLEAWPAVRSGRPDAELVVAGGPVTGKEAFYASLAARALALPGVWWMGERDDIGDLMADADVVLSAATEPEPYGLSAVEALASGAKVVVTDRGGLPEIVARARPGGGLLVPPGDPPRSPRPSSGSCRRSRRPASAGAGRSSSTRARRRSSACTRRSSPASPSRPPGLRSGRRA